ncbi:MAG TPA: GDP-mannose 4,6-dehydratase [Solirubrobacterales bacterium]|nr:GDP-mannose 4,6-dehydratase [Solirubrobacterales bacterium]
MQPTMLLIGARGFAGAHVREAAESAGLRVLAASREPHDEGVFCDLLDPTSVGSCVEAAAPDLVVNMAGAASVAASWERPGEAFAVNAGGVLNLFEAVARHTPGAHLLCVSSAEVYGEPTDDRLPFGEELALKPVTPYGASKAAMEVLCGSYARGRGLRIATIRAFNQLGPGQSPAFAASGFARQIAAAEAAGAERVELAVGNLAAVRDFTDVRDTARAFVATSQQQLIGTYNLCSGAPLKLEALVEEMAKATPLPVEVRPDPSLARPVDPSVVYGDPARLSEETGWAPEIPLSQSVADLLDWWRAELAAA